MTATYRVLAALAVVIIFDIMTTFMFRTLSLPESNPLVAPYVDHPAIFVGFKVATFVAAATLALMAKGSNFVWLTWAAVMVLSVVVVMNVYAIGVT